MKVRLKVLITGYRNGQKWPGPGGVVDLPSDEAAVLCAQGYAEPVAEKPSGKREKRVVKATESRDEPEHVCAECGFEAASAGGLGAHKRSHGGDD